MESIITLINETYGNKLRVRISALIIKDHKLLLLKQNANNFYGYLWLPPGGGLNFGETIKDCLKRETLEETGLLIEEKDFFGLEEYLNPPLHAIELFYETKIKGGELQLGFDPELNKNQQLLTDYQWFDIDEIEKLNPTEKHKILHNKEKIEKLLASA